MRYYEITITQSQANLSAGNKAFSPITFSTLNSSGLNNPSALKVEIDAFQTYYHQPSQHSFLRISGVSYDILKQGNNFNNANISIKVGMSKGLPFATPSQQGEIINGSIFQAFGNWQGNMVTLDLVILSFNTNILTPTNLSFTWDKGVSLETAIRTTLQNGFGTFDANGKRSAANVFGNLDARLIYTETQPYTYNSLQSFSYAMWNISKQIIPDPTYAGVGISAISSGFLLNDGTAPIAKTVQLQYQDLIGNVTWINTATIQTKLVMRGDISIGDYIKFPTYTPVNEVAGNNSQARNNPSFSGVFRVNKIRHVGNSRQADANSWVTILDCTVQNTPMEWYD